GLFRILHRRHRLGRRQGSEIRPKHGRPRRGRLPPRRDPRVHPGHHLELRFDGVPRQRQQGQAPRSLPGVDPAQHRPPAVRRGRPRHGEGHQVGDHLPHRWRHHLPGPHRLRFRRRSEHRCELRSGEHRGRLPPPGSRCRHDRARPPRTPCGGRQRRQDRRL
ncbi:MAG: FIG01044094: hypothetical protein, partial [uncultured Nocardioidaceae bacterium]